MQFGGAVGKVAKSCWRFESRERPTMIEVHLALIAALKDNVVIVGDDDDDESIETSSLQSSLSSDNTTGSE